MTDTQTEELDQHIWNRRGDIVYRLRVSILYHLKRERFFDGIHKLITIFTAISATAAVGVLLKKQEDVDIVVAAITAVLSLLPLVYAPAERARHHAASASAFRRLLIECEAAGEYWTLSQCDSFQSRIVEQEATEPAVLSALVADCQNQLAVKNGDPIVHLRFYQRWFKNWWDFDASRLAKQ